MTSLVFKQLLYTRKGVGKSKFLVTGAMLSVRAKQIMKRN